MYFIKHVILTFCRYMLFRAGVPRHAIIKKFAGEEISCLDELISVLSKLSRGARVPLEYISYMDRHRRKVMVTVQITYSFKLMYICTMQILFITSCHNFQMVLFGLFKP